MNRCIFFTNSWCIHEVTLSNKPSRPKYKTSTNLTTNLLYLSTSNSHLPYPPYLPMSFTHLHTTPIILCIQNQVSAKHNQLQNLISTPNATKPLQQSLSFTLSQHNITESTSTCKQKRNKRFPSSHESPNYPPIHLFSLKNTQVMQHRHPK